MNGKRADKERVSRVRSNEGKRNEVQRGHESSSMRHLRTAFAAIKQDERGSEFARRKKKSIRDRMD